MRRITLICILVHSAMTLSAQRYSPLASGRPLNVITVNLLGEGSNASLNYERLVRAGDYLILTGRLGAGYGKQLTITDSVATPAYFTIPVNITINAGKGRHFAEVGIGSTLNIGDVYPHFIYYLSGGYRLQPLKSGNLSLRIFGSWLINSHVEFRNLYFVPFGISIGFAF